jgi:signal transduction histidine kinase
VRLIANFNSYDSRVPFTSRGVLWWERTLSTERVRSERLGARKIGEPIHRRLDVPFSSFDLRIQTANHVVPTQTATHQEHAVRVLLVEDSQTAAEIVRRRLNAAHWPGLVLAHASSLDEAEPLLELRWDLVLLDLGLPGCRDLEALRWMRARCPDLPIVVLTGQDDVELAMRALEAEAQDYLVKRAIDTDTLVRSIRYAIGRQSILARLARAVEDATQSEARLRELMVRSSDGIVVVGPDDRVLFANPAALELLACTEADLLGQPLDRVDLTRNTCEIALDAPEHRVLDVRTVHADWQGTRVRMALLRDVTERARAEELRVQLERSERLAAVGRLAAGIAHEINNPLTYVRVNLELALRRLGTLASNDAEFLSERLSEAEEGIERVVRIVRDLRVFARVEADSAPRPIDVRVALENALKMAEPHLKHRARVHRALDAVPKVLGNEGRLAQVFLNLLVNAAQAIDEGHVGDHRIEVHAQNVGDEVVIEVRDTGRGIPPEHFPQLFEPFFSTKKPGEGSGLGLSICRNIIQSYGGSIAAESELGRGTCVRVRLPAWRGHESQHPLADDGESAGASHPRRRVLVVDDEPAIARALSELLRSQHEICIASSGEEAQAILERGEIFDVVLCDLVMDYGTGMELYLWIEKNRAELACRVIFMSGGGTTPETQRFLAEHAEHTLAKPLAPSELLMKIREIAPLDRRTPVR